MARGSKTYDDSLEREYRILATQHSWVSQSYHALADVLLRERSKRGSTGATKGHAPDSDKNQERTESLSFPEGAF